jgi:hypothetical protein
MRREWGKAGRAAGLVVVLALAGCETSGTGSSLGNILVSGTAAPPPATVGVGDPFCPPVAVLEGGSILQSRASVISLGQLARECAERPDGSVVVKIGAEGRVVLGAGASGGRFDVPVRFVISDGAGNVIATRVQRAAVTVPAGQGNALFAVVEEGIVVPRAAAETFEIEVGLGAGPAPTGRRRG